MTLMDTAQLLGNFGEFVGAIAVVATLLFLSFQVRQGARAQRGATLQSWVGITAVNINEGVIFSLVAVLVALGQTIRPRYHLVCSLGCHHLMMRTCDVDVIILCMVEHNMSS